LLQPEPFSASITPKALSVNGLTAADKIYDGNTATKVTGVIKSYGGVVDGDYISLVIGKANFDDANAGLNKPVTFSGFSLAGSDKDNYSFSQPASVTANIEKATPQYREFIESLVLEAIQGQILSEIALPEGFTWDAPETLLDEPGEQTFTATYTSQDTDNYHIITGIPIIVVVSSGNGIFTVEGGMKVYPTLLRSGESLQVESDMSENEVIRIFSATGSLVKQEKVTGKYTKVRMNVSGGVYILRLQDKKVKVIVK
jgi:hypothetical protein